jgi:hypothetical protein
LLIGFAQEIGLDLPRFKADMRTCEAVWSPWLPYML